MHAQIVESFKKNHMKWTILMFQHQLCGIDLIMRYIEQGMEKNLKNSFEGEQFSIW